MQNKKNSSMLIYETNDIENAKAVAANYNDVSVVYHDKNRELSPVLTSIIDGKKHQKYNPEYIEYLKEKFPGMSEKEIMIYIKQKLSNNKKEETESFESKNKHK